MYESLMSAAIAINTDSETVRFFDISNGIGQKDTMLGNYRARPFDDEFFQKLDRGIKAYKLKNPVAQFSKVSLILPNHVFLTDTIKIPALNKRAMEQSLDLAFGAIYKNRNDLKYKTYVLTQNKQFSIYGVVGIRKDLLEKIGKVCSENEIDVQSITFASNASANAAIALNQKLKAANFLLLDIKENEAQYAFVNKGRTVGYYSLPFGHSILYKSRLAAEDLLFDHTSAELLVLNAKEKAKAKQITMMGEEIMTDADAIEVAKEENSYNSEDAPIFPSENTYDGKKAARKLPKFMQRELPTDREGFLYENFRIFVKWTLDLLANNPSITSLGAIDTVYVNMPSEYAFLLDKLNEEKEENKVIFEALVSDGISNPLYEQADELELFGALHTSLYNKMNNF
ncbi:MAG: hypothetical protein J6K88_01700 [Oscillospiraceae bacterium]|nr:hypothetical protein [Oscillospiraceae bacterium]